MGFEDELYAQDAAIITVSGGNFNLISKVHMLIFKSRMILWSSSIEIMHVTSIPVLRDGGVRLLPAAASTNTVNNLPIRIQHIVVEHFKI